MEALAGLSWVNGRSIEALTSLDCIGPPPVEEIPHDLEESADLFFRNATVLRLKVVPIRLMVQTVNIIGNSVLGTFELGLGTLLGFGLGFAAPLSIVPFFELQAEVGAEPLP